MEAGKHNIFHLALKKHFPDSAQLHTFIEQTMQVLSYQQGFMAEIRAKKWIFKG